MNDLMKDFVTWTARANREAARNAEEGVEIDGAEIEATTGA